MQRSQAIDRVMGVMMRTHGGAYSRAAAIIDELERMGLVAFPDSPDRKGRVRRGPGPGGRREMISAIAEGVAQGAEAAVTRRKG